MTKKPTQNEHDTPNVCQSCRRRRCVCTPSTLRKRIRELELALSASRKLNQLSIPDQANIELDGSLLSEAMFLLSEVVRINVNTHETGVHGFVYVTKEEDQFTLHSPNSDPRKFQSSDVMPFNPPWMPGELITKLKCTLSSYQQFLNSSDEGDFDNEY